jgi:cell division protein FtsB
MSKDKRLHIDAGLHRISTAILKQLADLRKRRSELEKEIAQLKQSEEYLKSKIKQRGAKK